MNNCIRCNKGPININRSLCIPCSSGTENYMDGIKRSRMKKVFAYEAFEYMLSKPLAQVIQAEPKRSLADIFRWNGEIFQKYCDYGWVESNLGRNFDHWTYRIIE